MSEDPTTALGEAMAQLHEMFLSMTAAGFTEYQACVILGSWFAASGQSGQTGDA